MPSVGLLLLSISTALVHFAILGPCFISAAEVAGSQRNNRTRGFLSAETFNYQFDDPIERVICTKGKIEENKRYNDDFCKKKVFDQLEQLNFYIIGDMGGSSLYLPINPYTTHAQRSVAAAMAALAREKEGKKDKQPQFVVNLGDNFYLNGVKDENDERFQRTFEDVYEEKTLNVPWFPIPGNHDYHGNVGAQIRYTNRSSRWTYSAKNDDETWYKIHYEFGAAKYGGNPVTIEFLMIDTIMLCGETEDVRGDSYLHWIFHDSHKNPTNPPPGREEIANAQKDWLKKQLENSKADYLFIAGHYPIYSVGKHGSFADCLDWLNPMMRNNRVTAYLSGHDHNLQHLRIVEGKSAADGSILDYIVSGAGSSTDRSQEHWDEFKNSSTGAKVLLHYPSKLAAVLKLDEYFSWSTGGFVHAQAKQKEMVLSFYSGQGTVCAEAVPLIGGIFSGLGKVPLIGGLFRPLSMNCKTLVHQTTLCPRNGDNKACREKMWTNKEQDRSGWFY